MLPALTIGQRLTVLVIVLIAIAMTLGGYGMHTQSAILQDFSSTYNDRVVPLQQLKKVSDGYAVSIVDAAHKVHAGAMDKATFLKELDAARGTISREWHAYRSTYLTDQELALAGQAEQAMKRADGAVDELRRLVEAGDEAPLLVFNNKQLYPALDPVSGSISALIDLQLKVAAQEYTEAEASANFSARLSAMLMVAGVLFGALLAWQIIRNLLAQLGGEPKDVVALAQRIAKGDLSQKLQIRAGDSSSVVASMGAMQSGLIALVRNLESIIARLSVNASELAAASEQVAVSTEEQTRAAAAMSASVEQLSVSISSVSDNARDVSVDAKASGTLARDGERIIDHTLRTINTVADMARGSQQQADMLGAKSQQISNVIQVIRDVAEQTNLLALNAAIEAARAGEQGRGFAVVADEVRKLSERTASSTAEISLIINEMVSSSQQVVKTIHDTVDEMDAGLQQTLQAREAVSGISGNMARINDSVAAISIALAEQQSASGMVASNVEQVAQMSEETSTAAVQTASSAEQMEQMAHELKATIDFFNLPQPGQSRGGDGMQQVGVAVPAA
ncbi:methyl-accepting chemotaxis protein [Vogesella mureinivorans]|jgi:methyl-accepting chemotaxis protein|uniref:methyl-accepting chemotaxis protein n=1 Tax=Vogesella mureinivorans TaxID=657276 RepID=UPI0011CB15E2|nr:methyl-accepting chemotaxis protein [Vogesella mureinivorans]